MNNISYSFKQSKIAVELVQQSFINQDGEILLAEVQMRLLLIKHFFHVKTLRNSSFVQRSLTTEFNIEASIRCSFV